MVIMAIDATTIYNPFNNFSNFGYNIMEYLILNNENIWKLINYNTPDALSQPNLSLAEKRALIYNGQPESDGFKVFTIPFVDDGTQEVQTQLRIYNDRVKPQNQITSIVDVSLDIITHNKIAILSSYQNRYDVIFEELMRTLNGQEVEGLGRLYFNGQRSGRDFATLVPFDNKKFYWGYHVIMSTNVGGGIDSNA